MPIAPVTIYDGFERAVVAGWGTATTGQLWQGSSSSNSSVSIGTGGRRVVPAESGAIMHWISTTPNATQEVLIKARWENAASEADFGLVLRRKDANNFYILRLVNGTTLLVTGVSNGRYFEISQTSVVIPQGGAGQNVFWMRFKSGIDKLYGKIWLASTPEPTGWSIETGMGTFSPLPSAGSFGIWFNGAPTPYTVTFDELYWYTNEDAQPSFPVNTAFDKRADGGTWGISPSGHLWEGNVSEDPSILPLSGFTTGVTESDGAHYAVSSSSVTRDAHGFIGPATDAMINDAAWTFVPNTSIHNLIPFGGGFEQPLATLADFGLVTATPATGLTVTRDVTNTVARSGTKSHRIALTANTATSVGSTAYSRYTVPDPPIGATITLSGWARTTNVNVYPRLQLNFYSGLTLLSSAFSSLTTSITVGSWTQFSVTGTVPTGTTAVYGWVGVRSNVLNATGTLYWDDMVFEYASTPSSGYVSANAGAETAAFTGVRGTEGIAGGAISTVTGYVARIACFENTLVLYKQTSPNTLVQIGITGLSRYIQERERWRVKVQAIGSNIYAKAWLDGTTEPSGWAIQVVDSSYPSGQGYVLQQWSTPAATRTLWYHGGSIIADPDGEKPSGVSLVLAQATDTSLDFTANYTGDADNSVLAEVKYRKVGAGAFATFATYASSTAYRTTTSNPKRFSGRITGLSRNTDYEVVVTLYDPTDGVVGTNPLRATIRTSNRSTTVGTLSLSSTELSVVNAVLSFEGDSDFDSTVSWGIRVFGSGSGYTNPTITGYMDAEPKYKSASWTGLTADTVYEVRAIISDADGLTGNSTVTGTVRTLGKLVRLRSISAIPAERTALIQVDYDLDTNSNSTLDIQYRSSRDTVWTTVAQSQIVTDRTNGIFYTTIDGLRPNFSYQVKAVVSDPDGVQDGKTTLLDQFSTKGLSIDPQLREKHYVYRVYDDSESTARFLGTWPDAPIPEFSYDQNGGVTDLLVRLPRRLSEIQKDGETVKHLNRVDVWAIDSAGDGIGPNLILDSDMNMGSWTLTTSWGYLTTGGPDDSRALRFASTSTTTRTIRSEYVEVGEAVPHVAKLAAKASGGKLKMYLEAFNAQEQNIDQSDDFAETVGSGWQNLRVNYTPPQGTKYLRMVLENVGSGLMIADKAIILPKELLVYRGRIESFTPKVTSTAQSVEIQVLGLISVMSDQYIDFLQYTFNQPANDLQDGRPRKDPADPSQMMKDVIDKARTENRWFPLYYTTDSIKQTGQVVSYTFRDRQLRGCFDKIRELAPPGWHYYVEPDGRVNFRGPEHVRTHVLRLDVEVSQFEVERSIRNLKNYVVIRGRQDNDYSENDGNGSIIHIAKDEDSIELYGKREVVFKDSNIIDPETAQLVAEGRLEEFNREEQRGICIVPDEKAIDNVEGLLQGYNIESFRPGDFVRIIDVSTAQADGIYWDSFKWAGASGATWSNGPDYTPSDLLPDDVPIKTIQFHGDYCQLEISERQPSSSGDFARLYRWLQQQDQE